MSSFQFLATVLNALGGAAKQVRAVQAYDQGIALHSARAYRKALPLIREAAEAHHLDAMAILGAMLLLGQGCREDGKEAVQWLAQAAESDHLGAVGLLGMAYVTGKAGAPIDMLRGRALLESAAERGDEQSRKMLLMIGSTNKKHSCVPPRRK